MANNQSITDFISNFGGGTRINRFRINGKIGNTAKTDLTSKGGSFHIRAASLPGSQVGGIPINYRGRTVIYPGDRVYKPWAITVLDENPRESKTGKTLYQAFHEWSNNINSHTLNTTTQTDPSKHFAETSGGLVWTVDQLDVNGTNPIRTFKLYNCWPAQIGEISLDMGQDNILATFPVTLVYSHWSLASNDSGMDQNGNSTGSSSMDLDGLSDNGG